MADGHSAAWPSKRGPDGHGELVHVQVTDADERAAWDSSAARARLVIPMAMTTDAMSTSTSRGSRIWCVMAWALTSPLCVSRFPQVPTPDWTEPSTLPTARPRQIVRCA
jgi:hypothetical protein